MRRRRAFLVTAAGCVAAAATTGLALWWTQPSDTTAAASAASAAPAASAIRLPAPVPPAFTVPTPRPLRGPARVAEWAPVLRAVAARAAPSASAAPVARIGRSTPEGTANIALVVARAQDETGRIWVKLLLPVLPNGTTGWVPRGALSGYVEVRTRLVVDLDRLTATLFRDGRRVFSAPVGVGRPGWPTPRGNFYVRNRLTDYRSPFYGPIAYGTSARSPVLTDWPAGGFVGIHGTNEPQLIPGRISHGCIRLRNPDLIRLSKLMPVGTPVTIR
jgi:lipoprotein-anchoring transpeptidase ErfK/SrfK